MSDNIHGHYHKDIDDIICENRVFECLGCGFVGREQAADEHQAKCDNPMKMLTFGGKC